MLRLTLALIAALALALTVCDNDEESIPHSTSPTPTTIADAITICPRIGVPGEATPSSPTPEPSCEPGADLTAPPGVRGAIAEAPPLPSKMIAMTEYLVFSFDDSQVAGEVALPPADDLPWMVGGQSIAWYTYEDRNWRRLPNTVSAVQSADSEDGLYSGDFDPIPPNLILLAEN